MAFSSIIRRNGASLALRALRTQRSGYHCCSALVLTSVKSVRAVTTSDGVFGDLFLGRDHGVSRHCGWCYSTKSSSSEDALLKVIESEIRCAEESDDHDKVEEVPGGFPFEIEDKPGYQTVTLSREYQGEEIKVEVSMPDLVTGEEDEGGNENDDDEKANQSSIPLVVSVAKGNDPCLEFGCTAYPDEVVIESLAVRKPENGEDQIAYEGPDFQDLDENLQKAFHKYLEIRGIKPSMTNFLYEYMINKDSREYLNWLKNLKKFVAA